MRPYTHDVESTVLSHEEIDVFAGIVQALCHLDEQHKVSIALSVNSRPQPLHIQDFFQRQARKIWRTELRV